jgi:hypothetical protein
VQVTRREYRRIQHLEQALCAHRIEGPVLERKLQGRRAQQLHAFFQAVRPQERRRLGKHLL